MHGQRGFTLLELLVAIAVLAILLSAAVPSFMTTIRNNRLATDANALLTVLTLARSEAIKRNGPVVVCRSTDGAACAAGGSGWQAGALIYADENANATLDAGEVVIRAEVPLVTVSTIASTNNYVNRVSFLNNGAVSSAGTFTISADASTTAVRKVVVGMTGRPRICDPSKDSSCS